MDGSMSKVRTPKVKRLYDLNMNVSDVNLILDTLIGSLSVKDGGRIWKYSIDSRMLVAKKLIAACERMDVNIHVGRILIPGGGLSNRI